MSDEAIVRLVVVDSTEGARRTDTTSAVAGSSPTQALGVDPNRLYREMKASADVVVQGFKTHISPVVSILSEIRDVSDKDYDYTEKEYRETTTQTSLLKMIGAALSGEQGAVTRELQKAVGLKSSDAQIISAIKGMGDEVRLMRVNLTPEATYRTPTIFDPLVQAIRDLKESMANVNKAMLTTRVAFGAIAGYLLTHTDQLAPHVEPAFTAAENLPGLVAQAAPDIKEFGLNAINAIVSNLPELMQTGAISAMVGAAIGGLMYLILPSKEKKEKSVNELLADISAKSDTQQATTKEANELLKSIADNTNSPLNAIRLTSNATRVTAETAGRIEALMPGYGNRGASEAASPSLEEDYGMEYAQFAPPPTPELPTPPLPEDTLRAVGAEVQGTIGDLEAQGVPDTAIPQAIPTTEVNEPPVPTTVVSEPPVPDTALPPTELHTPTEDPAWATWERPHHGRGWNIVTPEKLQALADVGIVPGGPTISQSEYDEMVALRRAGGFPPPGFARGGAVGTDTVPAMLSPGEVVVPKNMVDAGAVDHLRGKLPGFASGGWVDSAARFPLDVGTAGFNMASRAISTTDPAERLGQFGSAISSLGQKIGTAVPVVGAFVEGLGEGTKAVSALMAAVNQTVDKYSEYSPEIAQAQAMAEVQQTLGDMRRARQSGPELAKFVVAQADMQQKFEEAKLKILQAIMPTLINILEVLNNVMGSGDGIATVIQVLTAHIAIIAEASRRMVNIQEDEKVKDVEDPADILLNSNLFDTSVPGGGGSVPIR